MKRLSKSDLKRLVAEAGPRRMGRGRGVPVLGCGLLTSGLSSLGTRDLRPSHRLRLPCAMADTIGEGTEYRARGGESVHGSALTLGEAMVHASVEMAG